MSSTAEFKSDPESLCAEYALGVLPYAERQAFEKQLKDDASLRKMLEKWEMHLSPLNDNYEPISAPASILSNVESLLFEPHIEKNSWWDSVALWRTLTVGSLAGALTLVIAISNIAPPAVTTSPTFIAEIKSETPGIRLAALYDSSNRTLKLNRIAGEPANARDFELWLIAGNEPPVSLGVVPAQQEFEIALAPEIAARLADSALFAISDEPLGGSPTGQPTGAVLAVGQVAKI